MSRGAYNGISNPVDSNPSAFEFKNQFFRIFRFEINLDSINVKNCKVGKTNNFNKFCSGILCAPEQAKERNTQQANGTA